MIWHLGASIFLLSKVFSLPGKLRNISMCQIINIILGTTLTIVSFWQLFLQQMPFEFAKKIGKKILLHFWKFPCEKDAKIDWRNPTIDENDLHDVNALYSVKFMEIFSLFYKFFVKATFFLRKVLMNGFHEIFLRWENFSFFHTVLL